MTCIFFPTGATGPVGPGSVFTDAVASCQQNNSVVFFPPDLIQNAVMKAALSVWVSSRRLDNGLMVISEGIWFSLGLIALPYMDNITIYNQTSSIRRSLNHLPSILSIGQLLLYFSDQRITVLLT